MSFSVQMLIGCLLKKGKNQKKPQHKKTWPVFRLKSLWNRLFPSYDLSLRISLLQNASYFSWQLARTLYLSFSLSRPPPLPTHQSCTHLSPSHHPAIHSQDEVTPCLLADGNMVMVWEKNQVMRAWKCWMLPISFLFLWTYFILFPCLKALGKASSRLHPAAEVPLLSISPSGFQVAAAFAQGRGFPKRVTLATRNFSPAKTPPRTSWLQCARRWASIYHFLQGKNMERGRWCLPGGISDKTDFFPGIWIFWFSWHPLFNHCMQSRYIIHSKFSISPLQMTKSKENSA